MKDTFKELETEVDQNVINRKHDEIERKNLLIVNDNLIVDCLSKELFYIATNSELTVSRITEMHEAHTIVQTCCLELEAELSKLWDKVQKDDHTELVKHFSNLEASLSIHNIHDVVRKVNQVWKPKQVRKVWKPTSKVLTSVGHQWRPTSRIFTLGEQCPLTRLTKLKVIQIVLWYLDSGYSKHMMGDRSRLKNFMKKFIGTVRFGNDHFGAIIGYGDYVIGDSVISRVYYVEGLGHNLFSVRQFCDSDLEVAFRKHSCYVRDTDGVELIKGSRGSNLYTILVKDMMKSSPICLLSKASKNKSWLWHHRLHHLNFGTINDLARKDLVKDLTAYYERVRIFHQKIVPRSLQQNSVVERRNNTLVEAARTMLIFSKAPMFLWAKAVLSTGPAPTFLMPGQITSGLIPNTVPAAPYVPPTNKELEILFQPMFDEYLEPPRAERPVSPALAVSVLVNSAGVAVKSTLMEDNPFDPVDNNPFINVFASEPSSEASSSGDLSSVESPYVSQTLHHLGKWSKDHPLDNIIGNPS
ncbi:retrovirus-related pol polyprotein from transposon TNT 1-94 [Tanacetum coccineum]